MFKLQQASEMRFPRVNLLGKKKPTNEKSNFQENFLNTRSRSSCAQATVFISYKNKNMKKLKYSNIQKFLTLMKHISCVVLSILQLAIPYILQ